MITTSATAAISATDTSTPPSTNIERRSVGAGLLMSVSGVSRMPGPLSATGSWRRSILEDNVDPAFIRHPVTVADCPDQALRATLRARQTQATRSENQKRHVVWPT